jgi:V/A-type H+-transporting ATPase subunit F
VSSKEESRAMAAIGDYETVLPFQAVGVTPFILKDMTTDEFRDILLKCVRNEYAVVFLQEEFYVANQQLVQEINETSAVSIVTIPGIRGGAGAGLRSIRSSVERAVGMDIFAVK